MQLWQLRTFVEVAKTLNFTRASEHLNLSQPAVSHQIKALEMEMNSELFFRDKDGISLTPAGEKMYLHAQRVLKIADELRLEIEEKKDYVQGKVVISASPRGLNSPFPELYAGFREIYKDIEVSFISRMWVTESLEDVRSGTSDIGVIGNLRPTDDLAWVPYSEYRLVIVAGNNHRIFNKSFITPEDLESEDWIMFEPDNRMRIAADEALAQAGIKPKKVAESTDGAFIVGMVERGHALSVLPEWGVMQEIKAGRMRKLDIPGFSYSIRLWLVVQKGPRSKEVDAVLSYLLEKELDGITLLEPEERSHK